MNKKILVLIIAVILIIIAGFAFFSSNSTSGNVSVSADALEDMGNIVVNNTDENRENGLFTASASDLNSILVTNR